MIAIAWKSVYLKSRIGRYIVRMIGVLNKPCCCGYNGWIRVMQQTSCVSIV